MNRSRFNRG